MASRAQIARISARIEALAPRDNWRIAVIYPRDGETKEKARERHFRERPEDRTAHRIVQVVFVAPGDREGAQP
jgi:hypothetical protein